jgi:hypothetical protein
MGYGGYAPGMNSRMAGPLSEFEQALRGLPLASADGTLDIIETVTRNVVRAPKEEKFRKLKLTNRKIKEAIVDVPGAVNVLREMGWVESAEGPDPVLLLPETARLAFETHVVQIIEAKDYYKKELENEKRRKLREERDANDEARAALREKLEQDAKERAAREQPAKASVAQKLGTSTVVRAADLGIGQSKGG